MRKLHIKDSLLKEKEEFVLCAFDMDRVCDSRCAALRITSKDIKTNRVNCNRILGNCIGEMDV